MALHLPDQIKMGYDLTGFRFAHWFVLRRGKDRRRQRMWVIECDCGNLSEANSSALITGRTTRCRDCANQKMRKKTKE